MHCGCFRDVHKLSQVLLTPSDVDFAVNQLGVHEDIPVSLTQHRVTDELLDLLVGFTPAYAQVR